MLRLWRLDVMQFTFGNDQTGYMTLAREGILRGALPVTGIPSSIHTLNPPLSVYLIMPFAVFTANPLPVVVSIALWNVLGVALCYMFALRYFGRRVAAVGTLLFATCGVAVDLSRFLWQQNYLAPLIALWALTLFAGCVSGSRRWFMPHVVVLVAAALLHPTAALLVPVTVVGFLLAPRLPRLWEYAAGAGATLVLLLPSILWEAITNHEDIHRLRQVAGGHARINLDVVHALYQVLGSPTSRDAGIFTPYAIVTPGSSYAALGALHPVIEYAAWAVFTVGYLVLTGLVLVPLRGVRLSPPATVAVGRRLLAWPVAVWRGLRADAVWRAYLLLWLWVTVPLILLVRHSSPVYAHYLLVLYPGAFIVGGVGVHWLLERGGAGLRQLMPALGSLRVLRAEALWQGALLGVVALVVAGQATQCALYIDSLAGGQFEAAAGYGYTLGTVQAADDALTTIQRQQGATAVSISTPLWYYRAALEYLLVREHPDRMSFAGDCLVLPAATASPVLVVSTTAQGETANLLAALPNASHVAAIAMPGGEPFVVYRLAGQTPALPGETPVAPVVFHDAAGNGLRLDAVARITPTVLRLRWTVLGTTASGQAPRRYQVRVRGLAADGAAGDLLAQGACEPTRWQAGETAFTWVAPPPVAAAPQATTSPLLAGPVAIQVWDHTEELAAPSLGPLHLLAGQVTGDPPTRLPVALPLATHGGPAPGAIDAEGEFVLLPSRGAQP